MTQNFLLNASLMYEDKCPELSRFLLQRHLQVNSLKRESPSLSQSTAVCPYCYQWLRPDNHRVRLKPRRLPTMRVRSLLRRKARGKRLTPVQESLLRKYQKSSPVLMATCHTCNKTSRHRGMSREFITALTKNPCTPGSGGKHRTPQSSRRPNVPTPKTPGKDKTPVHTPRSSTASSTPGSASPATKCTPKGKNWVVQRLSKILLRENNQNSKKGSLKDFLFSI
ncbi:UPF0711 protein C18orf21 homolog [Neosynchiropus ocellatus]